MKLTPSCFECYHHERVGRSKSVCLCRATQNWRIKADTIYEIYSGQCKAFMTTEAGRKLYEQSGIVR